MIQIPARNIKFSNPGVWWHRIRPYRVELFKSAETTMDVTITLLPYLANTLTVVTDAKGAVIMLDAGEQIPIEKGTHIEKIIISKLRFINTVLTPENAVIVLAWVN